VIIKARSYSLQGNLAKLRSSWNSGRSRERWEQTELLLDLYLKNSDWDQPRRLRIAYLKPTRKILARCKGRRIAVASGNGEKSHGILEKSGAMTMPGSTRLSGN